MRVCSRVASALVGTTATTATLAVLVSVVTGAWATALAAPPSHEGHDAALAMGMRPGPLRSAVHSGDGGGAGGRGGTEPFKRLYDFGLGKRASYVAEYKRLPMYNFGIGKRGGRDRPLGAAPPGMYAFGVGKRDDEPDLDDDMDNSQNDLDDSSLYDLSKRAKMYSFGLGKRGRLQYSFGIGKRAPIDTDPRLEDFLVGNDEEADELLDLTDGLDHEAMKRRAPQQYAFGLGKRRPGRYDFGLGKRTPRTDAE